MTTIIKKYHKPHTAACNRCIARNLCIANKSLDENTIQLIEKIIERKRTIHKGEIIYKAGDEFKNLYAIRSGTVKIFSINEQGDEKITSFQMSGDIIGFDGIANYIHLSFAQALETISVCEIPFHDLSNIALQSRPLYYHLIKLMSIEISNKKNIMMIISTQSAEQRLASFLVNYSNNLAKRKMARHEIKLTMTRYEIGNYLSLTVETISRLLTKFTTNGYINVHRKYISILKLDQLRNIIK
ncbi:MAG: fumarate/nitrate reduction transcriptional regulator Fnr [Succinivibrionaceae bacterium]